VNTFEGLGMENVCIFYGHLEYFTIIWYILWPFGKFGSLLVCAFFSVLVCLAKKNLATVVSWVMLPT
jgi:hypothetical protein